MQCPVCTRQLTPKLSLETTLYSCPNGCGLWFAAGTLPRYLKSLVKSERIKPTSTRLFQRRHVERVSQDENTSRKCPECQNRLQSLNYGYDSNVWIERCPICTGFWADRGKVTQLARHFKSDPKIVAAGQILAQEAKQKQRLPDSPQFTDMGLSLLPIPILPTGTDEECERVPWVTISLITLCCIVYLYQWQVCQDGEAFINRYAFVPAHVWSIHQITSLFLHHNVWHLIGHMVFLWFLGRNVEDRLGWLRFLGLYFFGAMAANLLTGWATPSLNINCIGASGAIAGIMGAYLILFPLTWMDVGIGEFNIKTPAIIFLLGWFAFQIYNGLFTDHTSTTAISWFSQVGGFVGGLLFAMLFRNYDQREVCYEQE